MRRAKLFAVGTEQSIGVDSEKIDSEDVEEIFRRLSAVERDLREFRKQAYEWFSRVK